MRNNIVISLSFLALCFSCSSAKVDVSVKQKTVVGPPAFVMCKKTGDASQPGLSLYAMKDGVVKEPKHMVQRVAEAGKPDSFIVLLEGIPTSSKSPGSVIFVKKAQEPLVAVLQACGTEWSLAIAFDEGAQQEEAGRRSFGIANKQGQLLVGARNGRCKTFKTGTSAKETGVLADCTQGVLVPPAAKYIRVSVVGPKGPLSANDSLKIDMMPQTRECKGPFAFPDMATKSACAECTFDCSQSPARFKCKSAEVTAMCNAKARPICTLPAVSSQEFAQICQTPEPTPPAPEPPAPPVPPMPGPRPPCPECPVCPPAPVCPECPDKSCPVCPECPLVPECPECPECPDKPFPEGPIPSDVADIPIYPFKPSVPDAVTYLRVVPDNMPEGQCVRFVSKRSGIKLAFLIRTDSKLSSEQYQQLFEFDPADPKRMPEDDPEALWGRERLQLRVASEREAIGLESADTTGFVMCRDSSSGQQIDCADAVSVDLWACAGCPECEQKECPECEQKECPECPEPEFDCKKAKEKCAQKDLVDCSTVMDTCEDLSDMCPRCDKTCQRNNELICLEEIKPLCKNLDIQPDGSLFTLMDVGTGDKRLSGGRLQVHTSKVGTGKRVAIAIRPHSRIESLADRDFKRLDSYEYYPDCSADPKANCAALSKVVLTKKGADKVFIKHPDPKRKAKPSDTYVCQKKPCDVHFKCWKEVENPNKAGDLMWVPAPCLDVVDSVCVVQ